MVQEAPVCQAVCMSQAGGRKCESHREQVLDVFFHLDWGGCLWLWQPKGTHPKGTHFDRRTMFNCQMCSVGVEPREAARVVRALVRRSHFCRPHLQLIPGQLRCCYFVADVTLLENDDEDMVEPERHRSVRTRSDLGCVSQEARCRQPISCSCVIS